MLLILDIQRPHYSRNFTKEPKLQDTGKEKTIFKETAAELMKNNIKRMEDSKNEYPSLVHLSSVDRNVDYTPQALQTFLRFLFTKKAPNVKVASVGQAVTRATRPRIRIAPYGLDSLCSYITTSHPSYWLTLFTVQDSVLHILKFKGTKQALQFLREQSFYLQSMQTLQTNHPDVCRYFASDFHLLRNSDRYWTGLLTDLCIEQVLMRSINTTVELTQGHGMSPSQKAQWLLSRSGCTDLSAAIQKFAQTEFTTSEQHREASKARQSIGSRVVKTILIFFFF